MWPDDPSHLFNAVWVDRGLWLKYAHWLCFGGALRHLPDLLGYEIMDTVKGLHSTLDQTHSLSRSCQKQKMREARNILWLGQVMKQNLMWILNDLYKKMVVGFH